MIYRNHILRRWLWLTALLACGCGVPKPAADAPAPTPSKAAEPLRVAAASDLQAVLPELAKRFTAVTKAEVSLTFGASGQLAEQLKEGAPFDVFLAANQSFVKDLVDGGFVRPESVRPYAQGTLALAIHRDSVEAIRGLADLARPDVKRVALANPAFAPYGAAGKQALERSGMWPAVSSKIVLSETVRQALQYVQSGNAEAGLVGRSIVEVPEVVAIEVDPKLYDPIVQALGVVARSPRPEIAEAFVRFVLGDEGQALLLRSGFRKPAAVP
ncbi:MAG: molybdate ABC transporter substrate-binding protein [Planctomycetaceae bacterium]|nr:molybdate ABC transporter substrate-binding protein [Planctomycetaceae bacterium]